MIFKKRDKHRMKTGGRITAKLSAGGGLREDMKRKSMDSFDSAGKS